MSVYNGTGYFIPIEDLQNVKMSDVMLKYPDIMTSLLRTSAATAFNSGDISLYDVFKLCHFITEDVIEQYGEAVCFAGVFKKYFEESEIDPDSGDAEMVEKLLNEDGYTYAVSNENESNHILETLTVLLKEFDVLSTYEVLESYWFLMPFKNE